ncbi:MAG: metal ABC transporter permease [Bacteroidetes bacterium]|jgi:manganese/zinc/iron transport system permease protein|nr:metal ABC transporter permease [Bacteroidota bacterium]
MTEYFSLFWTDYTVRTITLGTAVLGALSGMLGSFAVLRKESLLGDAISHAALPGIAIAFLITGTKDMGILLLGAIVSGLTGAFLIRKIVTRTHLKTDTALGLILSVFFGFGMLLLTYIQKIPDSNQAGLDSYLFGQAATLVEDDVKLMSLITAISFFVLILFWKEFKILLFDPEYSHTIGIHTRFIDSLITFFIVIAIVIGLQTVGVVLMSALLLAPAAAARQWTNRLIGMVFLSGIFGAFSGVIGTAISATENNIPTGPVIVLIAGIFVLFSFLFSPRGFIVKQLNYYKNRKKLKRIKTLQLMYDIASTHENIEHPHSVKILNNFQGYSKRVLSALEDEGWITLQNGNWSLTPRGFNKITTYLSTEKNDTATN